MTLADGDRAKAHARFDRERCGGVGRTERVVLDNLEGKVGQDDAFPRVRSAPVSAVSPAPRAWATSPVVPMRRKPKIQ